MRAASSSIGKYCACSLLVLLVLHLDHDHHFIQPVNAQGCSNQCPPDNFGIPVPSLCENDMADDKADIDRVYESCHPVEGASFRFRDFMGTGKVTVVSNFYIGCNAGRRETGVFVHVAQRYHDMYNNNSSDGNGHDNNRINFITSLKGGTNCARWAGIWQSDAMNYFPERNVVAKDVPLTVLDEDAALRDDFFTTPFGHPSYVILDGNLKVRRKFVGPCCGFESFYDCSAETARSLDATLSDYIDAVLAETGAVITSTFEDPAANGDVPEPPSDPPSSSAAVVGSSGAATTNWTTPPSSSNNNAYCTVGDFSDWSECSVTCGEGLEFRWRTVEGKVCAATAPPVETRACTREPCSTATTAGTGGVSSCIPEFGASWEVTTVASGFAGPRDVAFHPTPGLHLGNYSEGRSFFPNEGEEAWVVNGLNHSASIVASLGSPEHQTTISRRDRGYYHYMINATALAFNVVGDSGRAPDRDSFNYWAVCNDNRNTYLGAKEANYFMGPTLYDSRPRNRNIVNRIGEECDPDEECFFLHTDMLHEAPGCIGMAHDPETRTAYGNVYWIFDSTGNQANGQLVRFDFQQPHGPGSMDHSVAAVRRFPDVKLDRGSGGDSVHAGMQVHPTTRELFVAVPGADKIVAVHADSGAYARIAREEYPIYSNALPSFEYSIWECPEQRDFATGIGTPSGLALSPDGDRLFVAERATGKILVLEVKSGSLLFSIDTGFSTIGGMSFSPRSHILHFVDEETNTLNSVRRSAACETPVETRVSAGFEAMVQEAREALGNSFSLYRDYTCVVDPQIPDAIYFDQVHDNSGYASDNPDVQSEMAGMDAEAALLANRTDCEWDSELNFDALLLGGYFCHECLPETKGAMCDPGGTCTNVQWLGYTCDNEFLVMMTDDAATNNTPILAHPNKTQVDLEQLALRAGVTYRFTVKGDLTACLRDSPDDGVESISRSSGFTTAFGCATRGPLVATVPADATRPSGGAALYLHIEGGPVLTLPIESERRRLLRQSSRSRSLNR